MCLQPGEKAGILFVLNFDQLSGGWVDAAGDIFFEFAEGCDGFLVQALVLAFEISVDFGMAGDVPLVVAQNIRGEEVLGVAASAAPHSDQQDFDASGDFSCDLVGDNFDFDADGAGVLIVQGPLIDLQRLLCFFADRFEPTKPGAFVGDETDMADHWDAFVGQRFDELQAGTAVNGVGAEAQGAETAFDGFGRAGVVAVDQTDRQKCVGGCLADFAAVAAFGGDDQVDSGSFTGRRLFGGADIDFGQLALTFEGEQIFYSEFWHG